MEECTFIIKKGYFDRPKELTITEDILKFGNSVFYVADITAYKFGIKWIRFELTYGREFQIYIKNTLGEVLKVTFKTYLKRKLEVFNQQYATILELIWNNYFSKQVESHLQAFILGKEFTVGDVLFKQASIEMNISKIFKQSRTEILWENVRTEDYATYFAIYSIENPSEINRGYSYKEDWNTAVLYSTIRTILSQKGIEKYH